MKFSQKQIAALWIAEGGSPTKADLASAISMAESGGDSKAGNSCCHGLWQINVEVGNTSLACALNPVCATNWTIKESKNGRDWGPWEAYTNGAYRQFLGGGKVKNKKAAKSELAALASTPEGKTLLASNPIFEGIEHGIDPLSAVPGIGTASDAVLGSISKVLGISGLGDIAKVIEGMGELFLTREGWVRIAKLIGGVVLFMWGLRIVIRESTGVDPVTAATSTATKAAGTAATVATVK